MAEWAADKQLTKQGIEELTRRINRYLRQSGYAEDAKFIGAQSYKYIGTRESGHRLLFEVGPNILQFDPWGSALPIGLHFRYSADLDFWESILTWQSEHPEFFDE